MRWNQKAIIAAGAMALLLTACGGGTKEPEGSAAKGEEAPSNKPVTLYMLQDGATISDEEFANFIAAPVKAKYPHITVEMVRNKNGNNGLSELISSGSFPDLMFITMLQIKAHRDLGTTENLDPYIKKSGMNLAQFDPGAMQTSRAFGGGESVYAIPFSLNFLATFYNKDLFDRFGVSYPKEGMTWQDIIQLSAKFARNENGAEYRGLFVPSFAEMGMQLSLGRVDPATNKATINNDGWKKAAEVIKNINAIPGNKGATLDHFLKNQTLAMVASYDARFAALEKLQGTPEQFNWDVTQFPSYPDRPNTSLQSTGHFLSVSALGKNKNEAFQVIELLTGEPIQSLMTESGRFTALSNETIKNKYGAKMKSMQGKNIKAVFKSSFAPPYQPTSYDALTNTPLNDAAKNFLDNGMDINTALRQAEEASNKAIEAEINAKK
ncbi:ABC transporter substrate-binding protein [Paenibacillus ginsengarvi]|uniref:Extracellular solute-binding protein n=1 Tax=Paenibacillus ginsengarvi TaxID=400777 RepID=A0A3B0CBZ4_9BACL|nr:extracellular solute-binding protein [Paenibacillus ginsengarvi]RKN83905.1 extracellular solute-binding protein [Paenibacillus ginsengarvi]